MKIDFRNKVAVITGASSGIGKALSIELAERGAKVVLAARNTDALDNVKSHINSKGGDAYIFKCDVSNENNCKELIEASITKYNKIDILINNAGISMRALFDDVDISVIQKLMDVNFWGTVYCTKYALPYIQKTKGSITGVSSIAGYHGLPARTGYSASKYAMHGFLETIRVENLYKDVHVLIAAPGFTESNVRFSALTADGSNQGESPREEGKMMTSEEVANIIVKAIYKRKREVVMSSVGKTAVFLKKFVPAFLDKMFYKAMAKEPNSPLK
jgi:short-subunit dehydrogenase